jgi:hypothetical protein
MTEANLKAGVSRLRAIPARTFIVPEILVGHAAALYLTQQRSIANSPLTPPHQFRARLCFHFTKKDNVMTLPRQLGPLIVTFTIFNTATLCSAAEPTNALDQLSHLLDQYRLPRTLHVKVTTATDYKTIPPGMFHIDGTQEYWVDGQKFRILQLMNSAMFPGMSHDVRWDGDHYQWFNVNDSTLIVSVRPNRKISFIGEPMALLPLEFLNPGGDNLGVRLSLDDLRSDEVRGDLASAHFTRSDGSELEIPGGSIGDMATTYHLEFAGSLPYLPTTIRRMSPDGVELDTDEIKYQPVECTDGVVYLPYWTCLTDRTTDGRVISVATWTVTLMEADRPIPPETFTIDYQTAKRVIDIDHPIRHASGGLSQPVEFAAPIVQTSISSNTNSAALTAAAPELVADQGESALGTIAKVLAGLAAMVTCVIMGYRIRRTARAKQ